MHQQTSLKLKGDGLSVMSVVLGLIGAILTALAHLEIAASSHFDFLIRDNEFFLVLGALAVIVALSIGGFSAGTYALRHLNEPHSRYAKSAAIAGISVGAIDILPALFLLAIMLETLFLTLINISVSIE